jgi:integrating conjugative element protein (TIGR03752 family)
MDMAGSMSSNKLVWLLVAALGFVVAVVLINKTNSDRKATSTAQPATQSHSQVAPEAGKSPSAASVQPSIGGDADTVVETLKEVHARYNASEENNARVLKLIEDTNRRLDKIEHNQGRSNAEQSTGSNSDVVINELTQQLAQMKSEVSTLTNNVLQKDPQETHGNPGYEVSTYDLGWDDEAEGGSKKNKAFVPGPKPMPGYVAVRPMTKTRFLNTDPQLAEKLLREKMQQGSNALSTITSSAGESAPSALTNTVKAASANAVPDVKPYRTIPKRATGFEAIGMTALIGTVPVGGKVQDPFPVKFILGEENFAANGIHIPGLKGIVIEGIARGNWNLSCVAATLTGASFTFADGTVRDLEYEREQGGDTNGAQATSPFAEGEGNRGIGYIANPQGIPCVPGRRVTDAHKQLFTMGLLGAAKSYFDAKAAAETTTTENPLGGGSTLVTGDKSAFINNQTYSDSMTTVMDFYDKRFRDTFDVIYVEPARKVMLHFTRELHVDYRSDARKVAYAFGGNRHGFSMD